MALSGRNTQENLISHLLRDENDSNVGQHLTDLLDALLQEQGKSKYKDLENISSFLKKHKGYRPTVSADTIVPPVTTPQRGLSALETLQRSKVRYAEDGKVQKFSDDAAMLRWAGISFGDTANYDITLRIQRDLAKSLGNDLLNLRLWGKVLGTESDYWIAEGQLKSSTVALGTDLEPRGKGTNSYSYWVLSTLPGSEWELLPNVRPEWIRTSKFIRKHLTGDLNAEVAGFVPFVDKERAYLRALIARISASCTLCPAGAFVNAEDGVQPNPEFEFPSTDILKTQEAWIHSRDNILPNGLTEYPEVDENTDEKIKLQIEQERESSPPVEKLRGIAQDNPVEEGASGGWSVAQKGDTSSYAFEGSAKSYAVSVVRSNRWPGAFTVAQGVKYCNIYVGYGLRDKGDPFFPLAPGPVQREPGDDVDEQDEPNPIVDDISDQQSEDEKAPGEE